MRVRVPVAECQPQTFFLLAGPSNKTQDTCGIRAHPGIPNRVVIAMLSAAERRIRSQPENSVEHQRHVVIDARRHRLPRASRY